MAGKALGQYVNTYNYMQRPFPRSRFSTARRITCTMARLCRVVSIISFCFLKFNGCKGKPFFLTNKQNISFFLIKLLIVSNQFSTRTDYHFPIRFRHRDLSNGKPSRIGSERKHPRRHFREIPKGSKHSRQRFSPCRPQLISGKSAAFRRILLTFVR